MTKILRHAPRFIYQENIRTFFWNDRGFYIKHKDEILEWAKQYNCRVDIPDYGWMEVPNDDVKLLFILRWS